MTAFETILVPVDFSADSDLALSKAMELSGHEGRIVLLHVRKSRSVTEVAAEAALRTWSERLTVPTSGIRIDWRVVMAPTVHAGILLAVREEPATLIVIARQRTKYWPIGGPELSTTRLAAESRIPVLSVRPGARNVRIRTVVVPVGGELPRRKLEALELLCRRYALHVHLVAHGENRDADVWSSASSLLDLYQWVKKKLRCPVDYTVVNGSDKGKALLRYAERVGADILLLHPNEECRIGWWNRQIPDVLEPGSKMQVLAVHPIDIGKDE